MLKIPGFDVKRVNKNIRRRIQSIEGREKEGKTHYALTAPGPIAIIDLDTGLEDVIDKFGNKDILAPAKFNWREYDKQTQWKKLWEGLQACYYAALEAKGLRTLVIDTGTELWELARLAYLGQLSNVKAHWYGPVNAAIDSMLNAAYEYDKNVIITHKVKEEYIKDVRTGEYERAGYKYIGNKVQDVLKALRSKDGEFIIRILACRKDPMLKDMDLTEPLNNFPGLATLLYPDTSLDDWD